MLVSDCCLCIVAKGLQHNMGVVKNLAERPSHVFCVVSVDLLSRLVIEFIVLGLEWLD